MILLGDFNARTATIDDTLNKEKHEDIMLPDVYSGITSQRRKPQTLWKVYVATSSKNALNLAISFSTFVTF